MLNASITDEFNGESYEKLADVSFWRARIYYRTVQSVFLMHCGFSTDVRLQRFIQRLYIPQDDTWMLEATPHIINTSPQ